MLNKISAKASGFLKGYHYASFCLHRVQGHHITLHACRQMACGKMHGLLPCLCRNMLHRYGLAQHIDQRKVTGATCVVTMGDSQPAGSGSGMRYILRLGSEKTGRRTKMGNSVFIEKCLAYECAYNYTHIYIILTLSPV